MKLYKVEYYFRSNHEHVFIEAKDMLDAKIKFKEGNCGEIQGITEYHTVDMHDMVEVKNNEQN
jgi:hypothetical protein